MIQGALRGPETVRDRIIAYLRDAKSDSISGITRHLSEGRAKPLHRLTIAGHLVSLAESGVLRELERPPSKHYALADPTVHQDLYARLGRIAANVVPDARQRSLATLGALQHLLGRPIFRTELQRANAAMDPLLLPPAKVDEAERRRYLGLVRTRTTDALHPPRGDPLYDGAMATAKAGTQWPAIAQDLVRRVALEAAHAEHLADQRTPTASDFAKLDVAGGVS